LIYWVGKVRDELEHLLDDDMDMAEMYLTEKLMNQRLFESSLSRIHENDHDHDASHDDDDDKDDNEVTEGNRLGHLLVGKTFQFPFVFYQIGSMFINM
jgi:hypothetical protein